MEFKFFKSLYLRYFDGFYQVSSHCSMMRIGNNVYQSTTIVECLFLTVSIVGVVSSHCSMMLTGNNVYQSTTIVECQFLIIAVIGGCLGQSL